MCARKLPICAWVTLTAAFALLPFSAETQQARRPYRIGVLNEAWAANHPTVEGGFQIYRQRLYREATFNSIGWLLGAPALLAPVGEAGLP